MIFYLMRHGEAESFAVTDAQRRLTETGRLKLERQLKQIDAELLDIDCILHSPYQRAKETAALVSAQLGILPEPSLSAWTPDASPSAALDSLEAFADRTPLVVTHLPLVGYVTALCCEGSTQYPAVFGCGEIVRIKADWPAAGLGQLQQQWRPV
ncbi:phosphohistidine phosphatase SixA [Pontibacter sp. JAM-7]|uniref:phosphohistidine phosphatase SixA n=1 Tax=Pontibacter sp. JAM-7 TaxID=3366581 RepID=UPI003AF700E9